MYRLKLRLASGRTTYPRDEGRIPMLPRMTAVERGESMVDGMGYTMNLSLFGGKEVIGNHPGGFDPVIGYDIEAHKSPLDPNSFYLGGTMVSDSD